jgi:uncharacterized protein YbjT (DUF2867 family)
MTSPRTVLVTGATGTVGRPLALRLADDPELRVRALVRSPDRAQDLAPAGITLVEGDFESADALARACLGVDTLVLVTAANPRAADQAHAAIAAARKAGVRKVVRLSAVKADPDGPTDNTRQHGRTEAELRATGMTFVLLRPMAFMQNLLWSLSPVLATGQLFQGVGAAKLALVDTRDVVDALASATLSDDFDGRVYELTGPRSIGYAEVAEVLAGALGRPVQYVAVPPQAAGESMRALGADDWTVQLVHDYSTAYGRGFGDFTTDAVAQLTGHPARDIAAFVHEVVVPATRA